MLEIQEPQIFFVKSNPGTWEYNAVDECEALTSYPGIHIKSGMWLHVHVVLALSGADDKRIDGLAGYWHSSRFTERPHLKLRQGKV